MSKNTFFLITVFAGAALLVFLLTYFSRNRAGMSPRQTEETTPQQEQAAEAHDHQSLSFADSLDHEVDHALENIQQGKETGDQVLMMQEGILKLRAIAQLDTNNERAIYHLGILSLETNQLEKAKERFEKLLLLQPSNPEYRKTYEDIRVKLGE